VDPELPIFSATTARALTADLLARERRGAWLGTAFGAFGLLLASLGIYGSISYAVARRTREFGLRMALGSDRRRILNGLLGEVSRMVLMGGAIGLAGAVILARVLGASLAEVGPFDPVAFGAALILLTLAALGAGLLPALRATRISPLEALRHE
jgi:ABC-type antimicrobial peptide transport system permease subunit